MSLYYKIPDGRNSAVEIPSDGRSQIPSSVVTDVTGDHRGPPPSLRERNELIFIQI